MNQIVLTWYEMGEPLLVHTSLIRLRGVPMGCARCSSRRLVRGLPGTASRPKVGLVAGSRRSSFQHLRAGIMRELDRKPDSRSSVAIRSMCRSGRVCYTGGSRQLGSRTSARGGAQPATTIGS